MHGHVVMVSYDKCMNDIELYWSGDYDICTNMATVLTNTIGNKLEDGTLIYHFACLNTEHLKGLILKHLILPTNNITDTMGSLDVEKLTINDDLEWLCEIDDDIDNVTPNHELFQSVLKEYEITQFNPYLKI